MKRLTAESLTIDTSAYKDDATSSKVNPSKKQSLRVSDNDVSKQLPATSRQGLKGVNILKDDKTVNSAMLSLM